MEGGNTVYRETCVDRKPCHVNLSVMDDCHVVLVVVVLRELMAELDNEAAVDFFDDLVNTRKKSLEYIDRPLFKSFSKNCVVCVCECLCNNIPCIVPAHIVFVKENAHEFRNSNNRMCVVELYYVVLVELGEVSSDCIYIVVNKVLKGST